MVLVINLELIGVITCTEGVAGLNQNVPSLSQRTNQRCQLLGCILLASKNAKPVPHQHDQVKLKAIEFFETLNKCRRRSNSLL